MKKLAPPFDHIPLENKKIFSWSTAFSSRKDLYDLNGRRKTVGIIGAGIAGLSAAYELHTRNFDVTILESSDRCGGRILTHHFAEGAYGELGAMRIPLVHTAAFEYLEKFNLQTRSFPYWNPHGRLFHNGIRTTFTPKTGSRSDNSLLHFQQLKMAFPNLEKINETGISEGPKRLLLEHLLKPIANEIGDETRIWEFFKCGERSRLVHKFQSILLKDYAISKDVGLSKDDWLYLTYVTGIGPLENCTLAQFVLDMLPVLTSEMVEIVGGMEKLPQAFIKNIGSEKIITNSKVSEINVKNLGVIVTTNTNYKFENRTFDFLIVTIPPGELRKLTFSCEQSMEAKKISIENTKTGI